MRFGSAAEPLRWYISQPAKWGPLTSHFSRLPSDVRMNAPLRVPTRIRTLLTLGLLLEFCRSYRKFTPHESHIVTGIGFNVFDCVNNIVNIVSGALSVLSGDRAPAAPVHNALFCIADKNLRKAGRS